VGALAKLASSAGGPGPTCIAARRSKAHAEAELKNLGGMRDASCQFPRSSAFSLGPGSPRRASAARRPGKENRRHRGDNEARARAAGFGVPSPTTSADHTSRPVPAPRFLSAGAEPAARPVAGGGRGEKFKRWGPSYFPREELERPTFAC